MKFFFFLSPFPPIAFFRALSLHKRPFFIVLSLMQFVLFTCPRAIYTHFPCFYAYGYVLLRAFYLLLLSVLHSNSLCIHSHARARAHGKMNYKKYIYSLVMLFYYIVLCSIIQYYYYYYLLFISYIVIQLLSIFIVYSIVIYSKKTCKIIPP